MNYLKSLFTEGCGKAVTIKENGGGGANEVLRGVIKQTPADETFCMYDTDTGVDDDIKNKAIKHSVVCIENTPCLESLFLQILEDKDCSNHPNCKKCKKEFHTKHLDEKKCKDKRNYEKVFPKDMLTCKMETVEVLSQLIKAMS